MQPKLFASLAVLSALTLTSTYKLQAHCEVPCGIYNDSARLELMEEHCTTIEKSMKQIVELSKVKPINQNQLIRWVNTKEDHANKIQKITTQYFMTQRIKVLKKSDKNYAANLAKLQEFHKILVAAMKCKQTTDSSHVAKIMTSIHTLEKSYPSKHTHKH